MKAISIERIESFIESHKRGEEAAGALRAWRQEAVAADWKNPGDPKAHYTMAGPIGKGNGVAIFNIKGNRFGLAVRINCQAGVVKIEFIGTHEEYDDIDAGKATWESWTSDLSRPQLTMPGHWSRLMR